MKNYLEQDFEEHIEESLVNSGYTSSDPSIYDKTLCLLPTKLIGFIEETQPKTIEKLELQFGSSKSSIIKDIAIHGGDLEKFVHANVEKALKEKLS